MKKLLEFLILLLISPTVSAGGKILATPGVSQVEGAAGGGLVPWSQLAGYATENQWSASAFCTEANVDDYRLNTCGIQLNLFDRIEVSYAEQNFDVYPLSLQLEQNVVGVKARIAGDLIYSAYPQLSLGVLHKELDTTTVPFALGAEDDSGTDVYVAASKLHLGAVMGYNLFWNLTARHTEANELGLLGFGGPGTGSSVQLEGSAAILFNKNLAIGAEYRQKPDNLNLGEDDWHDVFVAWFPNKHVSVTMAYVDLGTVAQVQGQDGWYLSLMGYF
jgi:hypothetical protein